MGDICNPCHDPCYDRRSGDLFGGGIWVWIIVAVIIIWAISDNNNNGCC